MHVYRSMLNFGKTVRTPYTLRRIKRTQVVRSQPVNLASADGVLVEKGQEIFEELQVASVISSVE